MGKERQPRRLQQPDSIGGHIKLSTSLDAILAAGRARADEQAIKYLSDLGKAQEGLNEARELLALNALYPTEFETAKQEFNRLLSLPEQTPALKSAIDRVRAETEKPVIIEAPKKKAAREKPEEAKLTLPKGLKLSPKAKELIATLAQTSKDNTLAGIKIDKELYKGIPNKLRKNRRSLLISSANKRLEGTGFKIINVTPLGSNKGGSFYMERPEKPVQAPERVTKPEKAKKVQEPKGEVLELPDGQKLSGLGKLEKQVIEGLLAASSDHPVSYSELAKFVYSNVSEKTANNRLRRGFSRLREKLDKIGWKIVNLTPPSQGVKGKKGLYYLAPKEAQAVEEKVAPKEEAEPKKEVQEVPEEKTKLKLSKNEEELLRILRESPTPLNSEELSKMLSPRANRKKAHANLSRIAYSLKRKLVGSGEELVGPGKGRPGGDYYLRPEGSNEIKETSLDMFLPDGQKITVVGKLQKTLFERFFSTSLNRPVSASELKRLLSKEELHSLGILKSNLRKIGWTIFNLTTPKEQRAGKEAMYYLVLKENIQEAPQEVSVQKQPEEHVIFEQPEVVARTYGTVSEAPTVREMPYEPSEEEKRSEEETRILDAVVSSFLSRGKIYFEELQRQLKSDRKRIRIIGGEEWYSIYLASELKAKFFLGFNKLREESEVPNLRESWSNSEKELWGKVQTILKRMSGGEVEDFKKKVREEIDRAERLFYRDNPSEKRGLIKVDRNV